MRLTFYGFGGIIKKYGENAMSNAIMRQAHCVQSFSPGKMGIRLWIRSDLRFVKQEKTMEPLNEKHTVFSKRKAIFFDGILDPAREYADSFYETKMLAFQEKTRHRIGYRFLKRFFDLLVAVIFLVILSPLMLAVGAP